MDLDSAVQEIVQFVEKVTLNQARIVVPGLPTLLACCSDNGHRLTINREELDY